MTPDLDVPTEVAVDSPAVVAVVDVITSAVPGSDVVTGVDVAPSVSERGSADAVEDVVAAGGAGVVVEVVAAGVDRAAFVVFGCTTCRAAGDGEVSLVGVPVTVVVASVEHSASTF
ncbi:MAG: hypothetical protein HOV94_39605, partial [Saccharothrix sp.]|nr:hypothetical protein [Saccharothrix sp.]